MSSCSSEEKEKTASKGDQKRKDELRGSKSNIVVIFRYADWIDVLLMLLGGLGAIGDGMSTNVLLVFASRIMNSLGFGDNQQHSNSNTSVKFFMSEVEKVIYILGIILYIYIESISWIDILSSLLQIYLVTSDHLF